MKTIRFAVCGAGCRGTGLTLDILCNLADVEVCGVFDPYTDKAEHLAAKVAEKRGVAPKVYASAEALFDAEKPDAALVSTSWEAHIPVTLLALEKGIAVAMEVGSVYDEGECRALIETWERTRTPFMLMENCCFGKDELFATALYRAGVLGEAVYCHGAYMHDLREEVSYGGKNRHYRLGEYSTRNRDNYPTHDLGPIAKLLGINRGNRMVSLVSRSSAAKGLSAYLETRDDLPELQGRVFRQGDIVETLITCENGELISLRLDTTLPTYYSREFTVRGTKGLYEQTTNLVMTDEDLEHDFEPLVTMRARLGNAEQYYDKYLPKVWKDITPEEIEAGHGGMDTIEFRVFCDCLKEGREMPIDVYDAAAWMCIAYLSEESIRTGKEVPIPDFTNGAYKTRPIQDVIEL
ncbi:MAG: Gfo/Idh/MocA family oxidoreductase [Oscillospiraceae bacterium]|nr:Gfo/Idh/MocA family oxidoreductase [Oscillospiraceae bacterium]